MRMAQLLFFATISRCESFSAAADELFISQSSLSKQIIAMENELGVRLFDRSTRHVRLTPIGQETLSYVKAILAQYEAMGSAIEAYRMVSGQIIRLGGLPILYPYGLTDAIFLFEKTHPQYHVDITETLTPELLGMMAADKLDIGVVRFNLSEYEPPESVRLLPMIDDRQVLVVPKGHPLAGRGGISLEDAKNEEFIQLNTDTVISAYHLRLLKEHVPNAVVHLTTMKMDSIKSCIMHKGWVSLMMRRVAEGYYTKDEAVILDIKDPNPVLTLCLMIKKNEHGTPAQELADFLMERFRETSFLPR